MNCASEASQQALRIAIPLDGCISTRNYIITMVIPCLPILHLHHFVIICGQFVAVAARTIIAMDDTYGDAVTGIIAVYYNPPTKWIQGQPRISGDKCLVDPDVKEA
ncbi:hypothetical protein LXA43DRAFT_654910 [Ganoderma leucocontextum]|nr:hypothetical protein LXA43DRAFT_654910 [Ganoderma leucocontextum]